MTDFDLHFGGPDRPRGYLRDVLAERIAAVPSGGRIDWVTYYLRDRRLARDLVRARERGVEVRVTLDGHPRTPDANDAVCTLLRGALGERLRVVAARTDTLRFRQVFRPRLHAKLYCFSHPRPVAYIGSFNPSGDDPEERPDIVERIGDHDRGHNVLVGILEPTLAAALTQHAKRLHRGSHSGSIRFRPAANRVASAGGTQIFFQPRVAGNPVFALLRSCGPGHQVRIAASHLSGGRSIRALIRLADRGARVEVLAEATHRRVPPKSLERLRAAGVLIERASVPEGLPMHAKFALIEGPAGRTSIFGSFNWSAASQRTNSEIGAISTDPGLWDAFDARWKDLQGPTAATDSSAGVSPGS